MTCQSSAYLPSYLQAPLMIKTNLDFSLTATALKHGTKNFTKAKLDEELDFIGANVSTYASKNTGLPPTLQLKIKTRC
jgi:hypothetical protein